MPRPLKVFLSACALVAVAAFAVACGSQNISASKSEPTTHAGAVLFAQRCAGCHTLSYAGTHGSAAYVRDAQPNNGPNFDVRCERPVTRVLYAIQNGGFSGAYMPQNIVVGEQARQVAKFVATYSGRQSPIQPGVPICSKEAIGTLPAANSATASSSSSTSSSTTSTTTSTTTTTASKTKNQTAAATGSPNGKQGGKSAPGLHRKRKANRKTSGQ